MIMRSKWGLIIVAAGLLAAVSTLNAQTNTSPVFAREDADGNVIPPENRPPIPFAGSTIVRSETEVCITTHTRQLLPGVHTTWWAIFNNPEACSGGCGSDDVNDPAVDASLLWAPGGIVGPSGEVIFDTCLHVGPAPGEVRRGSGMLEADAEVHYILRYKGPARYDDLAILADQFTNFNGGCETDTQEGFSCTQPQIAVHK